MCCVVVLGQCLDCSNFERFGVDTGPDSHSQPYHVRALGLLDWSQRVFSSYTYTITNNTYMLSVLDKVDLK